MPHDASIVGRVAVFCGSSHGREPTYTRAAQQLGTLMVQRGLGLVYGGGDVGLMGVIADTVLEGGGEVIGVIPQTLVDREVAHSGLTELHVVDTMHQRKRMMYDRADAILALPGGIGTFEELFEALTWNQLGYLNEPCGLLNIGGYYGPLLEMLERMCQEGFVRRETLDQLRVEAEPGPLLDALMEDRESAGPKWPVGGRRA
ncbi:MAG: TIGR00730 family Rossman fold protein [Acidobacteriota bacterium]